MDGGQHGEKGLLQVTQIYVVGPGLKLEPSTFLVLDSFRQNLPWKPLCQFPHFKGDNDSRLLMSLQEIFKTLMSVNHATFILGRESTTVEFALD